MNKFVKEQCGNQRLSGGDDVIERDRRDEGNIWEIETKVVRQVAKWESRNRQWIAFNNPDAVKICSGEIRAELCFGAFGQSCRHIFEAVTLAVYIVSDRPGQ